jgi:lysophospholipid acyltransferase (LPLAT)-like uncharacterized protein
MIRQVVSGHTIALTIDGPKGPRYQVKSGAVFLAKKAGVPVIPIVAESSKFWTINSWDKLQIPKPFTKAKIFFGEPVFVAEDSTAEELESKQKDLQRMLDELVLRGKQWRQSKN